jgi:uncharacterized lipoprotein
MTTATDEALTSTDTKRRKRTKPDKAQVDVYAEFMARAMRAFGKKIGAGDVAALPELVKMEDLLDATILEAIGALISEPWCYSWQQIADHLTAGGYKISRQGVQQKYGKRLEAMGIKPARKVGAQPSALR